MTALMDEFSFTLWVLRSLVSTNWSSTDLKNFPTGNGNQCSYYKIICFSLRAQKRLETCHYFVASKDCFPAMLPRR